MKNIAIIIGGYSSEKEISIKSGNVVYKHLDKDKYNTYRVLILKEKWVVINDNEKEYPIIKEDFSVIINNKKIIFDCVFNAIHGSPGENGLFLAYLDLLGIKHTSAPFYQMALTFNKKDCLSVVKSYGIKTAKSVYLTQGDTYDINTITDTLGLPCFVKPNESGSSFGISKVNTLDEFEPALKKAFKEDKEVIIESFLDGTEVSIGVINYKGKIKVLAPTEIVSENEFFDYDAKYLGKSQEITPARISDIQLSNLNTTAEKVYKVLNMKGFSRAEYIFIGDDPYFIEINTVPGMTEASLLPQQAAHANISLTDLFDNAITTSLQ